MMEHSHLTNEQWKGLISGLVNNLSLNTIATSIGANTRTVWYNKQKLCTLLKETQGAKDRFKDIAECDEYYVRTSFKGKRDPSFFIHTLDRMPRHHRSYEEKVAYLMKNGLWDELQHDSERLDRLLNDNKYLRGISRDQTCILTCKDRGGSLYTEPICLGRPETADIRRGLHGAFASDAILVTDSHSAYPEFAYKERIQLEQIESGKHTKGAFNLARINALHSKLNRFYARELQNLPATKYLDLGIILFWWLEKNQSLSMESKIEELYRILNDHNAEAITYDKLKGRELSLNTKGLIPLKV